MGKIAAIYANFIQFNKIISYILQHFDIGLWKWTSLSLQLRSFRKNLRSRCILFLEYGGFQYLDCYLKQGKKPTLLPEIRVKEMVSPRNI